LGTNTVWRSGGLTAALVAALMAAGGASALTVRRPQGPTRDVRIESIKYASGTDSINAYIAYPAHAESTHAVVVIDETFGTPDFVRDVLQRIVQKGLVAMAPDLLSRHGGAPANAGEARKALAALDPDTVTQDLDAAATYLKGLKLSDTKLGLLGFGWGGEETFRYAAHNPSVRVFVVCYGGAPKARIDWAQVKGTGLGVYADRDGRVTQALYTLVRDIHKGGVDYRFKIYPNTSHGFLKTGQPADAVVEAWEDITKFLHVWLNQ